MTASARLREATPSAIAEGARLLEAGELVAFPTETVYGLGADATDDRAVARIFEAKARPSFNPLIAHLASADEAEVLAHLPPLARRLARRFWPGPLTRVLARRHDCPISRLASAGLETVALRVPAHPVANALLRQVGRPIVAPSANPSGRISPTTAAHVAAGLGDRVALILDGGATPLGLESTVLGFDADGAPRLLRPGALTVEELEAVAGPIQTALDPGAAPTAPGQLESHYAPRLPLRLAATSVAADEALLAFGPEVPEGGLARLNLSEDGDLVAAAANLFSHLHELDASGARVIAVMAVPEEGLGRAINDRLRRAGASRP
ncbi:MAG: L-threonylcarbamoyladenylate synthase [Alphaproteobacteria bacterium]|nr:L-threonylcarbamoyladenylate synthase [Alphaproteobacteria bacterium]